MPPLRSYRPRPPATAGLCSRPRDSGAAQGARNPGVPAADHTPSCLARPLRAALAWATALALLPAQAGAQAPALPQALLQAIDGYRAQQGLVPLQPDAELTALAEAHSQAMAQQRRLSHDGFPDRFAQAGRRLCVENLASGGRDAQVLLAAWQASPDHHANLVEPRVRQVGIALAGGYLTWLACTPAMTAQRPR